MYRIAAFEPKFGSTILRRCVAILVLILVVNVSEGRCGLVTGVSIYDVSSEFPAFGRVADNVVNGSRLVGDLHEWTNGAGMWHTQLGDFIPSESNFAHITFDLGATYDIDEIRIWNYGEVVTGGSRLFTRRGVKDFRISVATTDTSPSFTAVGDFTLSRAPIDIRNLYFESESLAVSAAGVRLVRFDIFSDHWNNSFPVGSTSDVVGLSEVAFLGTVTSVPEPSSLCFVAVSLAMACTKRKRLLYRR